MPAGLFKPCFRRYAAGVDSRLAALAAKEDIPPEKLESLLRSPLFAALLAGRLSGFGIYLLMSTVLGVISNAAGFALPFALYTTLSSALAAILGPAGWIGATLFAVWRWKASAESLDKFQKLVHATMLIGAVRSKRVPASSELPATLPPVASTTSQPRSM